MSVPPAPHDVLVVGWFPAADDPFSGRFVADQASALQATGRVRPAIVSFDPLPLHGDLDLRTRAAVAWPPLVTEAARAGLAFASRAAFGPQGIPIARLGTVLGHSAGLGRTHQVDQRVRALRALLAGLPSRPWRLVHAHVGYPQGAAAAVVAGELGLPLVLTEHATFLDRQFADRDVRASYREAAGRAGRIIAVSRFVADQITAEFPDLEGRVVVIPNAVDVDAFTPVAMAARDPNELLWVGYRREVKGTATLLRAFAVVRQARPAARLRLVGRSPTEAEEVEWRGLAADLGMGDAVAFDPPADRAGVAAAMARAAVFVHPSRRETMGVVAAEALAAGLPVVATDSGGVTEVLGPDPSALGALVRPDDPAALAAAIIATLERRLTIDPARLRAHAVERFAAAVVADRIADVYDGLIVPAAARGGTPSAPAGDASPARRIILVGFDRAALDDALTRCPAFVLRELVLVTSGTPVPGHADAIVAPSPGAEAIRELIDWRGRALGRGAGALVLAAPRWLVRRWRRRAIERRARRAMQAAVEAAIDRAAGGPEGSSPLAVCLGGIDIIAVASFVREGRMAIAPGGLRWLGDRRWIAQPGDPSSS